MFSWGSAGRPTTRRLPSYRRTSIGMWSAYGSAPAGREGSAELPPVLSLSNVEIHYPQKRGVIRGLELDVEAGEVVGLVGQSGSGKSTLALAILGLLDHTGAQVRGDIRILDRAYSARDLRDIRGRIVSLVPQSPAAALNPALRIGTHLREAWRA